MARQEGPYSNDHEPLLLFGSPQPSVAGPVNASVRGIGVRERPLLSHDGIRLTTFVRGTIVVRDMTDCDNIIDTGIQGAKADFSWNGPLYRVPRPRRLGPVATSSSWTWRNAAFARSHTFRSSNFYPSWTLMAGYPSGMTDPNIAEFMIATNVLAAPAHPLRPCRCVLPGVACMDRHFPGNAVATVC